MGVVNHRFIDESTPMVNYFSVGEKNPARVAGSFIERVARGALPER
jgi:hypothetical protein